MGHVWRGVVGTCAMGLGFAGLGFLPLPEVTAIGYAAPLLTVVFAAMFLGEEVRIFRISAVALGMIGVLIVLSPRLTTLRDGELATAEALGAMLVLGGAVFAALAQVFVRKLVVTESTSAIVFWFSLTATLLSLVTLPFGWVMPGATRGADAGQRGPAGRGRADPADVGLPLRPMPRWWRPSNMSRCSSRWSSAMSFFAEVPTLTMLGGAALVVTAGILIIWRERQLGLKRARQRKAMTPQG